MKYLRFFIVFVFFIVMVLYVNSTGSKEYDEENKVMENNVSFKGFVIDIKQSNNHAFGIISLKLTESSVKEFKDSLKNGIYPYRLQGSLAELYTIIPDGINYGDSVSLKSTERNSHFYYVKTRQKSEGYIWVVTEPEDIEFVKNNTIFTQ